MSVVIMTACMQTHPVRSCRTAQKVMHMPVLSQKTADCITQHDSCNVCVQKQIGEITPYICWEISGFSPFQSSV